jgi:hypothetical protein
MRLVLIFTMLLAACHGVSSNPSATLCSDGIKDGDETDVDCGGECAPCANGKACEASRDCASGSCPDHVCMTAPAQCSNGMKDGTETDVDCGGTVCAPCANGKACETSTDCTSVSCVNHVCVTPPAQCDDHKKDGDETDVDCGGGTCAPCMNGKMCVAPTDCTSGSCPNHICSSPAAQCLDGMKDGSETDTDCGGGTCPACADEKMCVAATDCTSGACINHLCATPPAQCLDDMKDGGETDVDCGGGTCPACINGKACVAAGDCTSGTCTNHVCGSPPAQCLNDMKDGNETDTDCGGGTCPACINGKACAQNADCESGVCTNKTCTTPPAQCLDETQDGSETDVDCGGGTCPACANGKHCGGDADCQSGTCANDVCSSPPAQCLDNTKDGNETDVDCGGGTCPACTEGKSCQVNGDCLSANCDSSHQCSTPMTTMTQCEVFCEDTSCDCEANCSGHMYTVECEEDQCVCEIDGVTVESIASSIASGNGGVCSVSAIFSVYSGPSGTGCSFLGVLSSDSG